MWQDQHVYGSTVRGATGKDGGTLLSALWTGAGAVHESAAVGLNSDRELQRDRDFSTFALGC